MTRVLGIEGTAWAASAAVFDSERDGATAAGDAREDGGDEGSQEVFIRTEAYQPDSGGIHPREAAEHMRGAIPSVVADAREHVRREYGDEAAIDAVAFSRGPGLGPCLRVAGTAARALAGALDVPLVGVNHMVAHLEIGRRRSGFADPVCLNASGANAHLLAYRNGRYRVLGETMDTGVGNAIDKFTRHLGWSHPGGPKVEEHAREGAYHELPYVVKGMDFSFSGIVSAAQAAVDDGVPVADVCRGLEETVFAILTEVSERALSLTDAGELVLGGGVGQNERLQGMLAEMCGARGADFYAPEPRFLRDNAGMIAALGATMYEAGDTLAIGDSRVRPDFRPDEVPVTWRDGGDGRASERTEPAGGGDGDTGDTEIRGAEARVTVGERVRKERVEKTYRHPALDERLRRERTRSEARLTSEARRAGVPTPVVFDVDDHEARLVFERVGAADLRADPTPDGVRAVGRHLAALHDAGVVHGDPTPRNARVDPDARRVYLIDFGLGYHTGHPEDHAMDLHVFERALAGIADEADRLRAVFEDAYADGRSDGDAGERTLDRLREIEGRGRYR